MVALTALLCGQARVPGPGGGIPVASSNPISRIGVITMASSGGTVTMNAITTSSATKLIVLGVSGYSGHVTNVVTDTVGGVPTGNVWALCGATPQSGAASYSQVWYTNPTTTGASHVITAVVQEGAYSTGYGAYYASSGSAPTCSLSDMNTGSGITTLAAGATGITTSALSLLVSTVGFGTSWGGGSGPTTSSGFANPAGNPYIGAVQIGLYFSDLLQTTIGTPANTTWGSGGVSTDMATAIVSFK